MMSADRVYAECTDALHKGLKEFGEYSYNDKGSSEILEIQPLEDSLKGLGPKGAAEVLNRLYESENGERLTSDLVCALDFWGGEDGNEFNDMYDLLNPEVQALY
jgi:hypothetical protein